MRQPRPGSKAITIWNQFLSTLTSDHHPRQLNKPLGAWRHQHSNRGTWESYYDPTTALIYHHNSQWQSYFKHGTKITLHQTINNFQPSPHYIPISVHTLDNGISYCHIHQIDYYQPSQPPSSWNKFIKTQTSWIQELLGGVFFEDISTVISQIQSNSKLIAVSDGSVKHSLMTYGWVLSTTKGTCIAKGNGPANGWPSSL